MPRNTRNVWLEAHVDGRASTLEGGPQSRDGGLWAVIYQRSNGGIGDERVGVSTFAGSGTYVRTEATIETQDRRPMPALMLRTHRDEPGVTVTLDVPGLTGASAGVRPGGALADADRRATITFATEAERDAFLSLLPAWREAQAEVSA